MTVTVYGVAADELGHCAWDTEPALDADGYIQRGTSVCVSPAANYRRSQPADIAVDWNHDGDDLGEIVYLERTAGRLHAVAVADLDVDDLDNHAPLYWSTSTDATTRHGIDHDIELRSLAITRQPASIGLWPLAWIAGDIRSGAANPARVSILRRAAAQVEYRWRHGPLVINEHAERAALDVEHTGHGLTIINGELVPIGPRRSGRSAEAVRVPGVIIPGYGVAPVEYRPAGQIVAVR